MISEGRYHIVLPAAVPAEEAVAMIRASDAELVSLNPLRDTLEDVFLARVQQSAPRSFD